MKCYTCTQSIITESAILSSSEGPDHLDSVTNADVSIVQVHESSKGCYGDTVEKPMTDLLQGLWHIVLDH